MEAADRSQGAGLRGWGGQWVSYEDGHHSSGYKVSRWNLRVLKQRMVGVVVGVVRKA